MKVWLTLLLLSLAAYSCAQQEDADIEDIEDFDESISEEPTEELKIPETKVEYKAPSLKGQAHLAETFDSPDSIGQKWVLSQAKKDELDETIAKYDGVWKVEEPEDNPLKGDVGLVLKSQAKHHAIAAMLDKPFEFKDKPFIAQYEVKFQNGQNCGGAYIKLLSKAPRLDLKGFVDKTPYTIMFGPDKCGNDDKLHFIFRHKNPKTGEYEEKHAKKPTVSKATAFTDKRTHLYTLILTPDNNFEIFVDQELVNSGSLLEDMTPAVNPLKEIVDPDDHKPEDWDDREKIADPAAEKPEDWDETEPEMIDDADAVKPDGWLDDEQDLTPDPDADQPSDWEEEIDGEWEPPMISNPACESAPGCGEWVPPKIKNPAYKGKWKAPTIDNPNYQGKWKPRNIPNPDFFEDTNPFRMTTIAAVGLELWSMSDNILFDNFLITDSKEVADEWVADTWKVKNTQEVLAKGSGKSVVDAVLDATNERPWLWAVFLFVIVLPIILIVAYCCMSSTPSKANDIARTKKNDAPTPDDKPAEKEEEKEKKEVKEEEVEGEEGAGDAKPKKANKKQSKSDLEAENASDEADAEEEAPAPSTPTRSSPRKRTTRARKD